MLDIKGLKREFALLEKERSRLKAEVRCRKLARSIYKFLDGAGK